MGIIAGSGDLPMKLAKDFSSKGGEVFVALLDGHVTHDFSNFPSDKFKIGEVGRGLDFFRFHGVTNLVMAGGVKRPNFLTLKVDKIGAILIAKIVKAKLMGDDKLLRTIAYFLEEKGFKIVSPMSVFSGQQTIHEEVVTLIKPSQQELEYIKLGSVAAKELGRQDIGQSVIVGAGQIIGLEDEQGTDALIERCKLRQGILVKMQKPMQDDRLDIPTIGEETVKKIAECGLRGIAVEADKVIILNLQQTIKLADELGIFIIGYKI